MNHEELGGSRILIVDDEEANLRVLRRLLEREGYRNLVTESDPRRAEELFRETAPDLVLLDLHMPHLDGFQVMEQLRPLIPGRTFVPILVLTGDPLPEVRERALSMGAKDFVTKPFEVTEVLLRIRNLLQTRYLHRALEAQNTTLEHRVQARTRELEGAQVEILRRLALAAEYRDDVTGQHAERVGVLSALIAEALGMTADDVRLLRQAAPLHDVGKIGIPDAILMKPGPLTPAEFEVMKSHTVIGGRILSGSRFPLLQVARQVALSHHEHWAGGGYTPELSGEEIPLVGRIVSVADTFDCLTHVRPYKQATSVEETVAEIRRERGRQFDPRVVDAFLEVQGSGRLEGLDELARAGSGLPGPV